MDSKQTGPLAPNQPHEHRFRLLSKDAAIWVNFERLSIYIKQKALHPAVQAGCIFFLQSPLCCLQNKAEATRAWSNCVCPESGRYIIIRPFQPGLKTGIGASSPSSKLDFASTWLKPIYTPSKRYGRITTCSQIAFSVPYASILEPFQNRLTSRLDLRRPLFVLHSSPLTQLPSPRC